MEKILIVDDGVISSFGERQEFLNGNEAHLAYYLGSNPNELGYRTAKNITVPNFLRKFSLASGEAYSLEDLTSHLKDNQDNYDRIVLDGLYGDCFQLINDVPLSLEKTLVFSGSTDIIRTCDARDIPHLNKNE